MPKAPVELEGVLETLLWTLWYRADRLPRSLQYLKGPGPFMKGPDPLMRGQQ